MNLRHGASGWVASGCAMLAASHIAGASPAMYKIDPDHTHPMFEADHGGVSLWRGIFKHTSGSVVLDAAAQSGSVDIAVDISSVEFGQDKLNEVAVNSSAPPIFESSKYPMAYYKGTLGDFVKGSPTTVVGELTLHGVTRPLTLRINSFKCVDDRPLPKQQVCGADAAAILNRADFGIRVGEKYGFNMEVTLRIQVEAIKFE